MTEPRTSPYVWQRRKLTMEERAIELEQFERELRAQTRAFWMRYAPEYVVWFVVGIFLMFWSFHTTDTRYAGLSFWGGIGLGDAGMLWTLIRARQDAEKRGLY